MDLIKTSPEETGIPSWDIEQEAYKFATSNGFGNAGVRLFYASILELGRTATLGSVRKRASELYKASKAITEKIEKPVQEATHKIIDGAHLFTGYEPAERPDYHPHGQGPDDAA